jgi:hypothetical protein
MLTLTFKWLVYIVVVICLRLAAHCISDNQMYSSKLDWQSTVSSGLIMYSQPQLRRILRGVLQRSVIIEVRYVWDPVTLRFKITLK